LTALSVPAGSDKAARRSPQQFSSPPSQGRPAAGAQNHLGRAATTVLARPWAPVT